jgi:hypothetical protein
MLIFESLNRGGIALLSDGTRWRVAPQELSKARAWALGCTVSVEEKNQSGAVWTLKMTSVSTGDYVNVLPILGAV